jgi:hypothetical protein
MKSAKRIEQSLKNADLDISIDAATDRTVLGGLVEKHKHLTGTRPAVGAAGARRLGTGLAAAAVIAIMAAFSITRHAPRQPEPVGVERQTASSIQMATALSLENAFRRGGIEALDDQSRRAFGMPREPSQRPSIKKLLGELDAADTKAWR